MLQRTMVSFHECLDDLITRKNIFFYHNTNFLENHAYMDGQKFSTFDYMVLFLLNNRRE